MTHPTLHQFGVRVRGDAAGSLLRPVQYAATIAPVLAWPGDGEVVIERRFWRANRRGPLQQAIIAGYRDPVGLEPAETATQQLQELLRPLRSARPMPRLTPAQLHALRHPVLGYAAELPWIDDALPEGINALEPLFHNLLEGLAALDGPVGLSLLVLAAGPGEEDDEPGFGFAQTPAGADGRPAPRLRRARFAVRIFGANPIPTVLRARTEAMCLSGSPEGGAWTISCGRDAADAAVAIGEQRLLDSSASRSCDARLAAFTLALREPRAEGSRLALGRPLEGALPKEGTVLGRVPRPDGRMTLWRLGWELRRLHTFICGNSGCGKTTTLLRIALGDVQEGRTVALIDFHGDVAEQLAANVPPDRLVFIDPRRPDTEPLDLLDRDPARAAGHFLSATAEVWPKDYAGPMFHRSFSITCRALEESTAMKRRWTLADAERFVTDPRFRAKILKGIENRRLAAEVTRVHETWQQTPRDDTSTVEWVASKLTPLTQGPGAPLFDRAPQARLEDQIADGAVIVVALPVGTLGTATASLAGRMFLARLTAAIAAQGARPADDRQPVSVIVDEAHLAAGDALGSIFAQARKFNASVTVACQSPSQLGRQLEDVLTNAQTHLFGRLSAREAELVGARIGEGAVAALPTLPRHHIIAALEDNDPALPPLILAPVPPPEIVAPAPCPVADAAEPAPPDELDDAEPAPAADSFTDFLETLFPLQDL